MKATRATVVRISLLLAFSKRVLHLSFQSYRFDIIKI